MASLYSVVIHPPQNIIDVVALLKRKLLQEIGPYPSCNSLAHITFNLFSGNESTLIRWEEYTSLFVKNLKPFSVRFDKIGTFYNGAFYIGPDETTSQLLVPVMKAFPKNAPRYPYGKSNKPHISVARKLSPEQLVIAKKVIADVHLEFIYDNLTIRKFNQVSGQYELHKQYLFS